MNEPSEYIHDTEGRRPLDGAWLVDVEAVEDALHEIRVLPQPEGGVALTTSVPAGTSASSPQAGEAMSSSVVESITFTCWRTYDPAVSSCTFSVPVALTGPPPRSESRRTRVGARGRRTWTRP